MRPDWKPGLARSISLRHDRVRDTDLLLMPERVVRLEGNAGLILRLCDGDHTTAQIIAELSAQFPDAPVAAEITEFLKRVKEEGWLK